MQDQCYTTTITAKNMHSWGKTNMLDHHSPHLGAGGADSAAVPPDALAASPSETAELLSRVPTSADGVASPSVWAQTPNLYGTKDHLMECDCVGHSTILQSLLITAKFLAASCSLAFEVVAYSFRQRDFPRNASKTFCGRSTPSLAIDRCYDIDVRFHDMLVQLEERKRGGNLSNIL